MYKAINDVGFVVDDILNSMYRFLDGALAQCIVRVPMGVPYLSSTAMALLISAGYRTEQLGKPMTGRATG